MDNFWENAIQATERAFHISPHAAAQILWTIIILAAYLILRLVIVRVIDRAFGTSTSKYLVGKVISYVFGILLIILFLRVWLGHGGNVLTYLGILSAGLAIAMQDPLVNVAGWLFIIIRHPFSVGDRIEIGDVAGDVVDVRLFQFTLMEIGGWVDADQSTGRIVHVPNGRIFKNKTANFTQGFDFIWDEMAVTVTFESNWKKAKEILLAIANEYTAIDSEAAGKQVQSVSQHYLIHYKFLTPIVWTKVVDIGVTLTIRYLCQARKRRSSETNIWEAILDAFAQHPDIDFAYPTQRFYDNKAEGKPGAGGPPRD